MGEENGKWKTEVCKSKWEVDLVNGNKSVNGSGSRRWEMEVRSESRSESRKRKWEVEVRN